LFSRLHVLGHVQQARKTENTVQSTGRIRKEAIYGCSHFLQRK
jgi:hypothetical protein